MDSWTDSAHALPTERECVYFLVVGHSRRLMGVYENHTFQSRWGTYGDTDVTLWQKIGDAPLDPPPVRTYPDQQYWSERPMREH